MCSAMLKEANMNLWFALYTSLGGIYYKPLQDESLGFIRRSYLRFRTRLCFWGRSRKSMRKFMRACVSLYVRPWIRPKKVRESLMVNSLYKARSCKTHSISDVLNTDTTANLFIQNTLFDQFVDFVWCDKASSLQWCDSCTSGNRHGVWFPPQRFPQGPMWSQGLHTGGHGPRVISSIRYPVWQ